MNGIEKNGADFTTTGDAKWKLCVRIFSARDDVWYNGTPKRIATTRAFTVLHH